MSRHIKPETDDPTVCTHTAAVPGRPQSYCSAELPFLCSAVTTVCSHAVGCDNAQGSHPERPRAPQFMRTSIVPGPTDHALESRPPSQTLLRIPMGRRSKKAQRSRAESALTQGLSAPEPFRHESASEPMDSRSALADAPPDSTLGTSPTKATAATPSPQPCQRADTQREKARGTRHTRTHRYPRVIGHITSQR